MKCLLNLILSSTILLQKYVVGESSKAVSDFKSVLCDHITGTKPDECNAKSSAMNIQATILPTIIALFISKMCI